MSATEPRLDHVGWFIATMHSLVGHDTTAAFCGQPPGDRSACVICAYERQPTAARKRAVIEALAPPAERTYTGSGSGAGQPSTSESQ